LAASAFAQAMNASLRSRIVSRFTIPCFGGDRQRVCGLVEQQAAGRDHAFQDADGVDDRRDRHPGNVSVGSDGVVVSVLVDGGLEGLAAYQVTRGSAVAVGSGSGQQPARSASTTDGRGLFGHCAIPLVRLV